MEIIAHKHHSFFKFRNIFSTMFSVLSVIACILSYSLTWGRYYDELEVYNDPYIAGLRQNLIDNYGPSYADPPPVEPVEAFAISFSISALCLILFLTIIFITIHIDKTNPEAMIYKENDFYYVYKRKIKDYIKIPSNKIISMDRIFDTGQVKVKVNEYAYRIERYVLSNAYMRVLYYDETGKKRRLIVQHYIGSKIK